MLNFIVTHPPPKVMFEIGCGNLIETRSTYCWDELDTCDFYLFEPNKNFCDNLIKHAGKRKNVHIFNYAILDEEKDIELTGDGSCGYIKGYKGASITNNQGYKLDNTNLITNKAFPLSHFDNGDIDHLYLDTEGTEWFALKTMISRPSIIDIEMIVNGHENPYYHEILKWMKDNLYLFIFELNNDYIFTNNIRYTVINKDIQIVELH